MISEYILKQIACDLQSKMQFFLKMINLNTNRIGRGVLFRNLKIIKNNDLFKLSIRMILSNLKINYINYIYNNLTLPTICTFIHSKKI